MSVMTDQIPVLETPTLEDTRHWHGMTIHVDRHPKEAA